MIRLALRRGQRSALISATLALAALLSTGTPAYAGVQYRLEQTQFAPLAAPLAVGARVKIARIPLSDGKTGTLELERFEVYAPDAVIQAVGDEGKTTRVELPAIAFFRGGVTGESDSSAFVSVQGEAIQGFVTMRERK